MRIELEKDILNSLGLNDTTITLGIDEDMQIELEHKVDAYLKKIDEEQKQKDRIDYLKREREEFEKKQEFLKMFNDSYVLEKIKIILMKAGFSYKCPTCRGIDLSGQYAKRR